MADIGSLMIKLGVDTSGVLSAQVAVQQLASAAGASAAKANAAMAMFSKETIRNMNTVSQRMRTFGYLATITLTAPIVAFTKSSVEMAKNFEFSMSKIEGWYSLRILLITVGRTFEDVFPSIDLRNCFSFVLCSIIRF